MLARQTALRTGRRRLRQERSAQPHPAPAPAASPAWWDVAVRCAFVVYPWLAPVVRQALRQWGILS